MSGTILIADAIPTSSIVLRVKLASAYYNVRQEETGETALAALAWTRPELIVASSELPDMDAATFCRRLRAMPDFGQTPLILRQSEPQPRARLAWLAAGADEVLSGPLDEGLFLARVRSLLREREREIELGQQVAASLAGGFAEPPGRFSRPAQIALVDTLGDGALTSLRNALASRMEDRVSLLSPEAALRMTEAVPDVFVVPEAPAGRAGAGFALLAHLRANRHTQPSALICMTGARCSETAARAYDLGACEVLRGGPQIEEFLIRLQRQVARKRRRDCLRDAMRDSLQAAVTDSLTGLRNRRYALQHLMGRLRPPAVQPYSLFLVDLDGFKQVNDTHGHAAGDVVLAGVGERLSAGLQAVDLVARLGGDEFLIGMPGGSATAPQAIAETARSLIGDIPFVLPDGGEVHIGASIGVATVMPDAGLDPQVVISRADRALYMAKRAGRDSVRVIEGHPGRAASQTPYDPGPVAPRALSRAAGP